jgi:hypothetical protein
MSWVYNRGLVFVHEDAHRWWPLRGVVRSIKCICVELMNIHRRHQTKGFPIIAADELVIWVACFWRVEPT